MDRWFYGTGAILDLGEVQAVYRREMDCAGGEMWNTHVLLSQHDELVIADYDGAEFRAISVALRDYRSAALQAYRKAAEPGA